VSLTAEQLEQIHERNRRQLAEQGLTVEITDRSTLAKVARLVSKAAA
jgi:hypothetical protein